MSELDQIQKEAKIEEIFKLNLNIKKQKIFTAKKKMNE